MLWEKSNFDVNCWTCLGGVPCSEEFLNRRITVSWSASIVCKAFIFTSFKVSAYLSGSTASMRCRLIWGLIWGLIRHSSIYRIIARCHPGCCGCHQKRQEGTELSWVANEFQLTAAPYDGFGIFFSTVSIVTSRLTMELDSGKNGGTKRQSSLPLSTVQTWRNWGSWFLKGTIRAMQFLGFQSRSALSLLFQQLWQNQ